MRPSMDRNISPHIYALSTITTVLVSYFIFYHWHINSDYFFVPVFGLAVVYTAINIFRQKEYSKQFSTLKNPRLFTLLRRSVARYIVWLVLLYIGYQFYGMVPYYNSVLFKPSVIFFEKLLTIYLIAGLPYFFITLIYKSSRVEDFYDPAIRFIHISKQITYRILRGDKIHSIFRVFRKKYNRKILLNIVMRAYFIPVMVSQITSNTSNAIQLTNTYSSGHELIVLLMLLSSLIWLCDTINASLAYSLESRWLENRTRSIDLTLTGWMVCLCCYPPLNNITSSIFSFAPNVVNNNPNALIYTNITLFYIVKVLQVSLLGLHVYIDLSLGPSVANITYKKLQTRGVYGIVRHPGTVTKLFFWLFISSFYRGFWNFKMLFGQLGWSVIYILRALTEERHLSHHNEYREYKKKVKYRFIPGLF